MGGVEFESFRKEEEQEGCIQNRTRIAEQSKRTSLNCPRNSTFEQGVGLELPSRSLATRHSNADLFLIIQPNTISLNPAFDPGLLGWLCDVGRCGEHECVGVCCETARREGVMCCVVWSQKTRILKK
jgi:hypothetical protein